MVFHFLKFSERARKQISISLLTKQATYTITKFQL